jgi:hypothetical protein
MPLHTIRDSIVPRRGRRQTFRLAPMTAELRVLTWVLFVLPVAFI